MASLEESKEKTTDQIDHKGLSHNCLKIILMIPRVFWENILWTDKTKGVSLKFLKFESRYICHETNTAFEKSNIITTVKHGGCNVMVSGCFAASRLGRLHFVFTCVIVV